MAIVKLISGSIVEGVKLTDIKSVGDEGSRSATAHIDGFNPVWCEQMDWDTYQMLKGTKHEFVEGSTGDVVDESV